MNISIIAKQNIFTISSRIYGPYLTIQTVRLIVKRVTRNLNKTLEGNIFDNSRIL